MWKICPPLTVFFFSCYWNQLNFFRKGIKSLEAIEPHVKMVAEKQHIDYQFSGLEDYETEDDDDDDDDDDTDNDGISVEDGSDATDNGELSFDYGQNEPAHDPVSAYRDSEVGPTPPHPISFLYDHDFFALRIYCVFPFCRNIYFFHLIPILSMKDHGD